MLKSVACRLPTWAQDALLDARTAVRALPHHGAGRLCPVCVHESRAFAAYGRTPRPDARCPRCGAMERHRLAWLFVTRRTDLFDGRPKRLLHFAPEQPFRRTLLRKLGPGYLSADLYAPRVMEKIDITHIPYPDESFDVVWCSHVLEHVPDDQRAMNEMHRVLKRGGWAMIQVPVIADATCEDPSIVSPEARLRAYGHEDHVRRYGPDVADRLRTAGFTVTVVSPADLVGEEDLTRMALRNPATGDIYFCERKE